MPPTFTTVLAEHLSRVSGRRRARGRATASRLLAGGIYVAPGGRHMRVVRAADGIEDRARRRCADQFLQAGGRCAVHLGGRGMGSCERSRWCSPAWAPTARAAQPISSRPAAASSPRTKPRSVVWGMPRAVAQAGLCSAVLPLDQIAPKRHPPVRRETARDARRLRFSPQVPQGALRPRAVGRQAISGRKPAAAGRAQGRFARPWRACRRAEARRTTRR